jgi:predicted phage tail protein
MQTVLLYGFLGKQFGRVHRYNVASPAEAVRALCATLKGFRQALADGGTYRVLVGGRNALSEERLADPISHRDTLRIVPVVAGAGRGIGQVLLGAALIYFSGGVAGAFGATSATATTAATAGAFGVTAGTFTALGASLILGGVSQMLIKPPSAQSQEAVENRPSFAFNGAVNTEAQGNPVPVLYGGPLLVGSQVVSAGLSTNAEIAVSA